MRESTGEATLSQQGTQITTITRATRHSRKLVRNVLRALTGDVFRVRWISLNAYLLRLHAEWLAGCRSEA